MVANRDQVVELLAIEHIEVFRSVPQNVDADFGHRLDREWMHMAGRLRPGAERFELISRKLAQPALRHVTAAGVAGTQEQDATALCTCAEISSCICHDV